MLDIFNQVMTSQEEGGEFIEITEGAPIG